MNNLLHDIKKLEKAKHHLILAGGTTTKITKHTPEGVADIRRAVICITSLIEEKQKIVDDFEKQLLIKTNNLINNEKRGFNE